MIVDIDNCVIVEFRLDKKLDVEKISKIIKYMEVLGRHELMKTELEEGLGATEVRVYRYEPKKIKVSEKEGGRHISEEVSVR
jgi:undecaprenyl pyrophosphate synthase